MNTFYYEEKLPIFNESAFQIKASSPANYSIITVKGIVPGIFDCQAQINHRPVNKGQIGLLFIKYNVVDDVPMIELQELVMQDHV